MRTYLVTGGAGFIGSNYIHYMFKKYGDTIRIINVDKLTYAGNLENLEDIKSATAKRFRKYLMKMILTGWFTLQRRAMWTAVSATRKYL